MKVWEIFQERMDDSGQTKSEYDWNQERANRPAIYMLVDVNGKKVRGELTAEAAKALQNRTDLVKRYGKLIIRKGA